MTILSVSAEGVGRVRLLVASGDDDEQRLTVTREEYRALGEPGVGAVLDEGAAITLLAQDEWHRACGAAERILAFGDNSRRRLAEKLTLRGFGHELSLRVCREMQRRGYLREEAQLERAVLLAAEKLWGPRRILASLSGKGYGREEIKRTVERLSERGEIDFTRSRRLLLARLPEGAEKEKKLALLYRFGY